MKFVIIGLGNFGASLGIRLIEEGHEVIGVDNSSSHIEQMKDKLTYVICADTTEEQNIEQLPIEEADFVVVSIGEDVGASLTTTALVKRHYETRIIARGISYIHTAILETMNVHDIINPEAEYANQLAERFSLKGSLHAYPIDETYEIAELDAPEYFIGKSIGELKKNQSGQLHIITILRKENRTNFLGKSLNKRIAIGHITDDMVVAEHDVLVLFGKNSDLQNLCNGKI